MTDLYKLPKDMLIKLVCTIREDLQKELDIKDEILDSFSKQIKGLHYKKCNEKTCNVFSIQEDHVFQQVDGDFYYNEKEYNGKIDFCGCGCEGCEKNADDGIGWFCKNHANENELRHYRYDNCSYWLCDSCISHPNNNYSECSGCEICK